MVPLPLHDQEGSGNSRSHKLRRNNRQPNPVHSKNQRQEKDGGSLENQRPQI